MPWLYALYGFGIGQRVLAGSALGRNTPHGSQALRPHATALASARASTAAVCMLRPRPLRLPLAPTLAPAPSLGFQPGHATR